jgi:protein-tyrosine-phosphatase
VDVFELVFVCTGNRARSPLAEALFRRYSKGMRVRVRSAGTVGLDRLPPLPDAVKAGRALDVDIARHRTRPLGDLDLGSADLVLGFEPFHVEAAIEGGAPPERVFLIGELVALLIPDEHGGEVVRRARDAVAQAHRRRVLVPSGTTATIADPVGKSRSVMQATAKEIDDLVHRLALGLFGEDSARGQEHRG